ncbi:MAG TPA: hypothetical protein GX747_04235, partial [Tenericutes bacterium]|nr:hypothetical protein [Mycoplasmatota bacterium]
YRNIPIIPFIVSNNYVGLHCFYQDDIGTKTHTFNMGDKIYIMINSFECFNSINNAKTSCYPNKSSIKKEVNDINYSLIIRKVNKAQTIIYDGDFTNNITDYFSEKGLYDVNIIAKYGNVKSVIFFSIRIVD